MPYPKKLKKRLRKDLYFKSGKISNYINPLSCDGSITLAVTCKFILCFGSSNRIMLLISQLMKFRLLSYACWLFPSIFHYAWYLSSAEPVLSRENSPQRNREISKSPEYTGINHIFLIKDCLIEFQGLLSLLVEASKLYLNILLYIWMEYLTNTH